MQNDDNEMVFVQYSPPSRWYEIGGYCLALGLFYASALTGNIWVLMALAALFMFWNYKLFSILRDYIRHLNASEFSRLLTVLSENEINIQKDGTFQDSSSLTKEQESEEDSS